MDPHTMVLVDELAAFMNEGWPGEDWYLTDHAEFLWEQTFTMGVGKILYRPRSPGQLLAMAELEATVRWQGSTPDPTQGRGYKLSTLFRRWQRVRHEAFVFACMPPEKLAVVTDWLEEAGCLIVNKSDAAREPQTTLSH